MSRIVLLDSGPLGLVTNPNQSAQSTACSKYLPLTTTAMRQAARFWARARQQGQPTAGDKTIDGDMILAGQAVTLEVPDLIITATTNVGHLGRYAPADLWQNIDL
ncbi:MAG TPA: hypothetical protein VH988_15230 [Thermoanaerobaculia bacterium]|nr:hypothetical protein [Thermoanaerobaculia bacterium]